MIDPVRQEVIATGHTVVVKVGTNVLTRADGTLEPARLQLLADQLQRIRAAGRKVALVSSGAIGAGWWYEIAVCARTTKLMLRRCSGLVFDLSSRYSLRVIRGPGPACACWSPTDGETQDETHPRAGDAERRKPAAGLRRLARRRRPG